MNRRFVFVVDTENYAGSFERELCGYVTGRYDPEGHHGSEQSKIAEKEIPKKIWEYFEAHVIDCLEEPDDLPIHTPVVAYPTPGWFNHGMGGHFRDGQEEEAFEDYKKQIKKYNDEHKGANLKVGEKLKKCPAYMSVGIFFDERPPKDVIEFMKARSHKFTEYFPKSGILGCTVKITGFRLLEETKKVEAQEEAV